MLQEDGFVLCKPVFPKFNSQTSYIWCNKWMSTSPKNYPVQNVFLDIYIHFSNLTKLIIYTVIKKWLHFWEKNKL